MKLSSAPEPIRTFRGRDSLDNWREAGRLIQGREPGVVWRDEHGDWREGYSWELR